MPPKTKMTLEEVEADLKERGIEVDNTPKSKKPSRRHVNNIIHLQDKKNVKRYLQ